MNNEKGGLIKKKQATLMKPAIPVKKGDMDFGFNAPIKQEEPVVVTPPAPSIIKKRYEN